jgi:four helix bundle protein
MTDSDKPRFNFRLYQLSLRALRLIVRVIRAIARHDANLADQAMRASTSWHLNIAEGMNAPGKTRNLRFRSALCSVDEVIGACDIGEALGYVKVTEEEADAVQHLRATLINTLRPKH